MSSATLGHVIPGVAVLYWGGQCTKWKILVLSAVLVRYYPMTMLPAAFSFEES